MRRGVSGTGEVFAGGGGCLPSERGTLDPPRHHVNSRRVAVAEKAYPMIASPTPQGAVCRGIHKMGGIYTDGGV